MIVITDSDEADYASERRDGCVAGLTALLVRATAIVRAFRSAWARVR